MSKIPLKSCLIINENLMLVKQRFLCRTIVTLAMCFEEKCGNKWGVLVLMKGVSVCQDCDDFDFFLYHSKTPKRVM